MNNDKDDKFRMIMNVMNDRLNEIAQTYPDRFYHNNGTKLEEDVLKVLQECAIGTIFEGKIKKANSTREFPDIFVDEEYGVEVKSTKSDSWTSTGSSIMETSRPKKIRLIYLTFGKLNKKPVVFKTRPYEECLEDICVTHYPRYHVNMETPKGMTIFDKMNIPYDELRCLDNPVEPVKKYRKSLLKNGEHLWWIDGDKEGFCVFKMYNELSKSDRDNLLIESIAKFPKIISDNSKEKYNEVAIWLLEEKNIVCTNIRDMFSSSGRKSLTIDNKEYTLKQILSLVAKHRDVIKKTINKLYSEKTNPVYYWISECKDIEDKNILKIIFEAEEILFYNNQKKSKED